MGKKQNEKTSKIKNAIVVLIIMTIISIFFSIVVVSDNSPEKIQYLNSLDYSVNLNSDGSMQVTEIWDINVKNTNTLFKTFKLNSSKYGDIDNVEVYDLKNNKKLNNTNEQKYHVPKDSYYGLKINDYTYEIAWGIGMDNKRGRGKYQISYRVNDVVKGYKDCQEFYWQFIGKDENQIPAKKVTGKIILPTGVASDDNLRVWGHGQLNGYINKNGNKEVDFNIDNLEAGAMLETRVVTKENVFNIEPKNINYFNTILNEETKWSEDTEYNASEAKTFMYIKVCVYIIICLFIIYKIIKYKKMLNKEQEKIKINKLNYFRDIPRENDSTPTEAVYLYKYNKERLDTAKVQRQAISAVILDLCLKKKISLRIDGEKVYVNIIGEQSGLKKDELEIYKLLKSVSKSEFEIGELNDYATKNYAKYSNSVNTMVNEARESLYKLKLIDKADEKLYSQAVTSKNKADGIKWIYIFLIYNHFFMQIPIIKEAIISEMGIGFSNNVITFLIKILPMIVLWCYELTLKNKLTKKISVLTQQGSDEKEQWKGLANFMKDYSKIKDKGVLDLVLWEKYLVYAVAFDISKDVIEELKASYPEVFIEEKWKDENFRKEYPIMDFVCNPIYTNHRDFDPVSSIDKNVNRAMNTANREISRHSSSSSSGSGGGFTSGGGGRWRSADGMGGR